MSSSRSIAAARNRRAGGNDASVQRGRPNTSIASQPAFAQQQQPTQRIGRAINQQQTQQPQQKQIVQANKISVSDAIGLITIRLGRVETYMQQLQEECVSGLSNSFSENVQLVDKEVLSTVMDRIYTIENKPDSAILINNKISILEKEVKEVKDLLNSHIFKFSQFITETEQKFLDIDAAFVEFEKNLQVPNVSEELNNIQLNMDDVKEEPAEMEVGPTFSAVDLKDIINQELANSEISL